MNFETAADSFIRPTIGRQAEPAHAAVPTRQESAAETDRGKASEQGAKAEHETAAMEFEFADLLDVVNPLQHIPVVSSLYRELTGDEIKAPARVLGGFLFGGPVGLVASVANAAIEESSGRDLGETVMAWAFGAGDDGSGNLAQVPAAQVPSATEDLTEITPAAASAAAAVSTPTASRMPATVMTPEDSAPRSLEAELPASGPAAVSAADSAPETPSDISNGPVLSGKAAINAFLNDLKAVGRSAAGTPALPGGSGALTQAAETQAAESMPADPVPQNLVGLGGRDQRGRSVARPVSPPTPAVLQIPGAAGGPANAQPAAASAAQGTATPVSGTDPRADAPTDFSAQMMQALQKYQTMLQQRDGGAGN